MDKLQESVKYYREYLQGKEIGICAGRKNEAIDLLVDFGLEQFKHLAGLHKLEDMPYIAKDKSRRLIERIENGEVTLDTISRSENCPQVIERLECINHIKSIITESKYIYKSPKKSFYNINADYMLSKKDESLKNIHLFLKEDQKGHVVPVSILSCVTDKFNNFPCSRWTILSKDKIEQQNKSRQDENTKENTSNTNVNADVRTSEEKQQVEQVGQVQQVEQEVPKGMTDAEIIADIAKLPAVEKKAIENVEKQFEQRQQTQQVQQARQVEQVEKPRQENKRNQRQREK